MPQSVLTDAPQTSTMASAIPIERRKGRDLPYELFMRDFVLPNKPVVIEDAVPQWRAIHEWTPEFFAERFGDEMVGVTYGVKMPMRELIEKVVASTPEKPGPYLHQLIIHRDMPALLPWLSPENPYGYPKRLCSPLMPSRCRRPDGYLKLLIGGPGGKFPFMHFDSDNANAVITEIYGDKAFLLFRPEDTQYLYPKPDVVNVSQVEDISKPDFERFPLLKKATPYSTVVKPGETIFIPSAWWHAARVVSTSISVCTNMLDSHSWPGFVDWLTRPSSGKATATRAAARVYLTLLGGALSTFEGLQKGLPGGRVFAPLSPLERKQTATNNESSSSYLA